MVTTEVINAIYRKFNKAPKSPDNLDFGLLTDSIIEKHDIRIEEQKLKIGSIKSDSPFAAIPLKNIHEILEFESMIAIVLRNSIVFLNKCDSTVNVHLRDLSPSFWMQIKQSFSGKTDEPDF